MDGGRINRLGLEMQLFSLILRRAAVVLEHHDGSNQENRGGFAWLKPILQRKDPAIGAAKQKRWENFPKTPMADMAGEPFVKRAPMLNALSMSALIHKLPKIDTSATNRPTPIASGKKIGKDGTATRIISGKSIADSTQEIEASGLPLPRLGVIATEPHITSRFASDERLIQKSIALLLITDGCENSADASGAQRLPRNSMLRAVAAITARRNVRSDTRLTTLSRWLVAGSMRLQIS